MFWALVKDTFRPENREQRQTKAGASLSTGNTIRQMMTTEGLFALLGCRSISGQDERSCGTKVEDKQNEK
jgi:hypothetical protein